MRKRIFAMLSVLLVLGLGVYTYFAQCNANLHEMSESYEINYDDEWVYGIDVADNNYYIYKINLQTQAQDFFSVSRVSDLEKVTVKSVVMHTSEEMYALVSQGDTNYIMHCRFDTDTLEPLFTITDSTLSPVTLYSDTDGTMISVFSDTQSLYHYAAIDGTVVLQQTTTVKGDYLYLEILDNNQVWAVSLTGDYSYVQNDGTQVPVFVNDGSVISRNNGNVIQTADSFLLQNMDTLDYYEIAYRDAQPIFQPFSTLSGLQVASSYYLSGGLYIDSLQAVLSVTLSNDGTLLPCMVWGDGITIASVSKAFDWVDTLQLYALRLLVGLGMLFVLSRLLASRKGISVLLIVGVTAVGTAWFGVPLFETLLTERLIVSSDDNLFTACEELNEVVLASVSLADFEQAHALETLTAQDVATYHTEQVQRSMQYYDFGSEQTYNIRYMYQTHLYFFQEDGIYAAQGHVLNTELQSTISPLLYQAVAQTRDTAQPVLLYYTNFGDEVVALVSPIFAQDGTLIGAIEMPQNFMDQYLELTILTTEILQLALGCIGAILIAIYVVIGLSLQQMPRLAQSATKVAQGDFSSIGPIAGRHEIARLNQTLIHTVHRLVHHTTEMQAIREKYNAFVPDMLLRVDDKNYHPQPGQSRDITGLSIFAHRDAQGLDEFDFFNQLMADDIAFLVQQHVHVERMDNFTLKAFAYNMPTTVDSCVRMIEHATGSLYLSITLEQVHIGVIGNEKRMAIKTISTFDIFATQISCIAADYQVPLIISGEAMLQIPNFHTRYTSRRIAYVYVSSLDKVEVIHEVIFGNAQQAARQKLDSLATFEEGLEFYRLGEIEQAMRRFIRVYRENPNDLIAKAYIFRCEERSSQPESDYFFLSL